MGKEGGMGGMQINIMGDGTYALDVKMGKGAKEKHKLAISGQNVLIICARIDKNGTENFKC